MFAQAHVVPPSLAKLSSTLVLASEIPRGFTHVKIVRLPAASRVHLLGGVRSDFSNAHTTESERAARTGRFTRAIRARSLFQAEVAARELPGLSLGDALELVILIAAQRPERFERAAVQWHGRLEVELPMLTLAESRFALAALERLPADPQAGDLLRKLLRQTSPKTLRQIQ